MLRFVTELSNPSMVISKAVTQMDEMIEWLVR